MIATLSQVKKSQTNSHRRKNMRMNQPQFKKQNPTPVIGQPPQQQRKWRIALYSHDTMGLGHKRRNLLIAQTLGVSELDADILLISGMKDANQFQASAGLDCLTLPALYKNTEGQYQARRFDMSLGEILTMRSQIIRTTLQNFKPDVFIVDNVPRGAMGELNATLQYLRTKTNTRCVLGLRDILDEPKVIRRSWKNGNLEDAIRRYYDAVWIYGDSQVYDSIAAYNFSPDIINKFRYTGYLDQRKRQQFAQPEDLQQNLKSSSKQRLALCVVGGGQDGGEIAKAFAKSKLPKNTQGVIITGPMMPEKMRQKLAAYAQKRSDLKVLEYVSEPTFLLEQADWVIAMGGYNTTCEILSFEKRALIVPRVKPRKEQIIRVKILEKLGLVDMLHPQQLNPKSISAWLKKDKPAPKVSQKVDLKGLERIPQFLAEILSEAKSMSN